MQGWTAMKALEWAMLKDNSRDARRQEKVKIHGPLVIKGLNIPALQTQITCAATIKTRSIVANPGGRVNGMQERGVRKYNSILCQTTMPWLTMGREE